MNEQTKAAFAGAADIAKQLITLATGLLALEITFLKDFVKDPSNFDVWLIEASWVLMSTSIALGLVALMALTGSLAQNSEPNQRTIYGPNVTRPMVGQIGCFLTGIVLSVVFALRSV